MDQLFHRHQTQKTWLVITPKFKQTNSLWLLLRGHNILCIPELQNKCTCWTFFSQKLSIKAEWNISRLPHSVWVKANFYNNQLKMVNKFGTFVKTVSQEDSDFYAESKTQFLIQNPIFCSNYGSILCCLWKQMIRPKIYT